MQREIINADYEMRLASLRGRMSEAGRQVEGLFESLLSQGFFKLAVKKGPQGGTVPEAKKSSQRPAKTSPDIHVDEKFLYEHLRDTRAEMSWRRELEFRLLQLLLVFYPIIGTVMVQLFSSGVSISAFRFTAVVLALMILAVSYFVISRIDHEHKAYAKLGKQVQMIWKYFGLFESGAYIPAQAFLSTDLLGQKDGYGQGKGYRRTQILIGALTFVMLAILIALAILKI